MENALPGVQGEYPRVNYTSIRPELLFTSDKEHRKDITCLPMTRRETATQHKKNRHRRRKQHPHMKIIHDVKYLLHEYESRNNRWLSKSAFHSNILLVLSINIEDGSSIEISVPRTDGK